jgi:periplasmic protein TonB
MLSFNRSIGQSDSVYTFVELMPQFKGGPDSLYKFIFEHIVYPPLARENGIQGMVVAQFTVDTSGHATDIGIIRGIGAGCNEEVIRILELMNEKHLWSPGQVDGKPVRVKFTLPITFVLSGKEKKSKLKKQTG